MSRFSLTQLFMGVALVAILLTITRVEGCGVRFSQIECLSFSQDGADLLVVRLDGQRAPTPYKIYKANVARTISMLPVADPSRPSVLQQDVRLGNQGTAVTLWYHGRQSAALFADRDAFLVLEFGGGRLAHRSTASTLQPREFKSLIHPVSSIAVSRTGRRVAASGVDHLTIVDIRDDKALLQVPFASLLFLRGALISFSFDDSLVAAAGESAVQVWDLRTARSRTKISIDAGTLVHAISFLPDNSILVCSDLGLRTYNLSGEMIRTYSDADDYYACDVSPDGKLISAVRAGEVELIDVASGERRWCPDLGFAACVAFSPDASLLAVGDTAGAVSVFEVATGQRQWTATAPGRNMWPWTVPALALAIWIVLATSLARRARRYESCKAQPASRAADCSPG